jgi:hypothetical protein
MFHNIETAKNHNRAFFDAMIDLKVQGWKSFAEASDIYTYRFFSNQLEEMTKAIEKVGEDVKTFVKGAIS